MAVGTESRVVACSRLPRITASDDIKKNNSKRPYIARLRGVKSFIGNIASLTFCCSCLNALTTKKIKQCIPGLIWYTLPVLNSPLVFWVVASPKSVKANLQPSSKQTTFSGFRSRWYIPSEWQCSMASRSWRKASLTRALFPR